MGVEAVEGRVPEPPEALDPDGRLPERRRLQVAPLPLPLAEREISAAPSSTLRCRDTAGIEIGSGAVSSVTVASPRVSSARIARRVGSASAANTRLSWSVAVTPYT